MESWIVEGLPAWIWFILGLVLIGAEIFVAGFVLFWFGVSSIVIGLLMLWIPFNFNWQLGLWVGLAITMVLVWNQFFRPRWKNRTLAGMASEALVGQIGTVLEPNRAGTRGRLRFPAPILGEDEWRFMCEQELAIGDMVEVRDIAGNALKVTRVAS